MNAISNLRNHSKQDIKLLNIDKQNILNKLKSKNNKYKRYLESPLRYAGGKSLAVGYIIELLPTNLDKVISPFFGGGSVEIAIAKELDIPVIGYDIFDMLVNYWNYQIYYPQNLYTELLKIQPTKENYHFIKDELKKCWNKETGFNNYLSQLVKAVYYFFNHNLSYGPGFLGWMSSIYADQKKYNSMLTKVNNFSVKNIEVHCEMFEKSIMKHKNDFLYLDPPYFLGRGSKMFKGIYPMRNFPVHHNNFNHEKLYQLLDIHNNHWILSYNDCSWIRQIYKKYNIIEVSWQYTMGQGEKRIGKNRLSRNYDNGNVKSSHELLITNF